MSKEDVDWFRSGVDFGLGLSAGQSCSDPAIERRKGRSTASMRVRLSFDGLGPYAREATGRAGKGFSVAGVRAPMNGMLCEGGYDYEISECKCSEILDGTRW